LPERELVISIGHGRQFYPDKLRIGVNQRQVARDTTQGNRGIGEVVTDDGDFVVVEVDQDFRYLWRGKDFRADRSGKQERQNAKQ
jgi:hypothetical protein